MRLKAKPAWWAQPFRPEGDNTGSGIKNQLGRPKLGEYAVLVREAVQNSWDARRGDGSTVSVKFSVKRLGQYATAWKKMFGSSTLPGEPGKALRNLGPDSLILIVSDRGTVGLDGPIRSDQAVREGGSANFIQFLRNVGEARDTVLGGGTYGFGKGIYYRISQASAILVDSRNTESGKYGRRLMGAALSDAFDDQDGRRFTGRHWWGAVVDGVPDPLLGEQADFAARKLGLPGFEPGATGSDIVIILPDLALEEVKETPQTLGERIRRHIYWNLWPKFQTQARSQAIHFSVEVEGNALDFPAIENIPVLKDFARALDNIAIREGTDYGLKKYNRPLGEFSTEWVVQSMTASAGEVADSVLRDPPVEAPYRHVARMRQAELVVDYFPTTQMPTPEIGYVGVFRATAFADHHFAHAEPPTHDDWSTAGLTGSDLGIVRGAASFIREQSEALVNARSGTRSKTVQGLGRLSHQLGTFVQSAGGSRGTGMGKKRQTAKNGKSTRSANKGFSIRGRSHVRLYEGKPVVDLPIKIDNDFPEDLILEASAYVVLLRNRREGTNAGPIGASAPKFVGWFDEDDQLISVNLRASADSLGPGDRRARFQQMENAALRVTVGKAA